MASKKRLVGCTLGCLVLLVVGACVVLAAGVAGGGAWWFLGAQQDDIGLEDRSAQVSAPSDVLPADDGVAAAEPVPSLEPAPVDDEDLEEAEGNATDSVDGSAEDGVGGEADAEEAQPESVPEQVLAPVPEPAPAPEPEPKPVRAPPPTSSSGGANVSVSGDATVVLLSGGLRYEVPGRVPAGKYDIEATFPGAAGVVVGSTTVSAGGSYDIVCHPRFQNCRVH